MSQGKICKRASPVIVRTFPRHSPNPDGEQYAQYCKCQLLKFKPWKDQSSNGWGGGPDTDETYIATYHAFLQTEALEDYLCCISLVISQKHSNTLIGVMILMMRLRAHSMTHQEEWMLLCQHNQRLP